MTTTRALPAFIKPMLAETGQPFDSDQHLFEIKWDGIRAMAYVEEGRCRLLTRRRLDVTQKYPEFAPLAELPEGTVLDGEIVVLDDQGKPDFRAVLSREQARTPLRHRTLARTRPASYVIFDQLYDRFQPLLARPLTERRERLLATAGGCASERVAVSDGVIGPGRDFYEQIVDRGMEGVMAKRLSSRYLPGRRSDAWLKIRKSSTTVCAILGFVPKGDDFESLVIAVEDQGALRCVGRVGTGFNTSVRQQLNRQLRARPSDRPLVACREKAQWITPGLYCQVRYLEMSPDGMLREPVFERLIENEGDEA